MIEFTDATLIEAEGSYSTVCSLMEKEDIVGKEWMIESRCFIHSPTISSDFIMHFWSDGKAVVWDTTRPLMLGVSEDDLTELAEWSRTNGWGIPVIHDRLLVDPRSFEYWLRMYLKGLVAAEELTRHDEEELNRLKNNTGLEQKDAY